MSGKHSLLLVWSLALVPPMGAQEFRAEEWSDRVFFRNGDRLIGRLLSMPNQEEALWQFPFALDPSPFRQSAIKRIFFGKTSAGESTSLKTALVKTRSGDRLPGRLLGFGDGALRLETEYASVLEVAEEEIDFVLLREEGARLRSFGRREFETWQQEENNWEVQAQGLQSHARGLIGGEASLGPRGILRFRWNWSSRGQIIILFGAESIEGADRSEGYQLEIKRDSSILRRFRDEKGELESLGTIRGLNAARANAPGGDCQVEIRFDREKARVILYLDDLFAGFWNDPHREPVPGDILGFLSNSSRSLQISELTLSSWDGRSYGVYEVDSPEGSDQVVLVDDDIIHGTIREMQPVSPTAEALAVTVETPGGTLRVPLERIAFLRFASAEASTAGTTLGGARLRLHGEGSFLFQADRATTDQLFGQGPSVGEIAIERASIRSLDFQPLSTP
ncbi:MAG: hypothetical protein AAF555_08500 [Verrucomicrobiota bacterium]